jgi:hypothetical protein
LDLFSTGPPQEPILSVNRFWRIKYSAKMEDRMERGRATTRLRLALALSLGIFALVLLAPAAANAQVTVFHVKVQVDGVTYCDGGTAGCTVTVWPAASFPISLAPNQTLILTQTGTIANTAGTVLGGNFDTSDRVSSAGVFECSTTAACPVTIFIDTGSGFGAGITPPAANALNNFGHDTGSNAEGVAFTTVATTVSYMLGIGYADTVHAGRYSAARPSMWIKHCPSPMRTGPMDKRIEIHWQSHDDRPSWRSGW